MKKFALAFVLLALLAAGCGEIPLKREVPTSPAESYMQLPK